MTTTKDIKNNIDFLNQQLGGKWEITFSHLTGNDNGRKYIVNVYKNQNGENDRAGVDRDWKMFLTKEEANAFLHWFWRCLKNF